MLRPSCRTRALWCRGQTLPEHVCQRDHSVTALAYCAPDRNLSGTVTVLRIVSW
jgi:hypothetical protein